MAHQSEPPPSIRKARPDLPVALDAVYLAMMAKSAADRPQSMADVIARLSACRSGSGGVHLSLESFSNTVVGSNSAVRAAPGAAVFRDRDDSGGSRIDTELDLEHRGLSDGSGELTYSPDETSLPERGGSGFAASHTRRRSRRMAAVCVSAVLASLGLIYVAAMWLGSKGHSPAATPVRSSRPRDVASTPPEPPELIDTESGPPEAGAAMPAEEAAIVAPKKTPEPRPVEAAMDPAARASKKAPDVAKPKPAKIPSFKVAPIFTRHNGPVHAIAVTGDGKVALSAGADPTARLWEVATGKQILELPPHPSPILDVAMTHDGVFALTVTRGRPKTNGAIRLWNLRTRQPVFNVVGPSPHTGPIQSVAFAANNLVLTGGHDGRVVVWNRRTGRPIGRLGSQDGVVRAHALAVLPGRRALTGGEDAIVHLWDLGTREQSGQWSGHEGPITDISVSADGRRAVTGSLDHTVILWDVAHGSQVRRFKMPGEDRARGVAILPDGNVLAAGLFGHVILWDANTGAILRRAQPPFIPHEELTVLPGDEQQFLTADGDGVVRMWTAKEP